MKTFQAKFNPEAKNVYGVSLVEKPAMEGDFIQFNKQNEIKFTDVDKSKRRVMGLILEPNKLIYRNQNGNEFNIMFTEQDIEDVAYNFQKQANQSTSTIEHSNKNIDGVTFVETWLVEDSKIDKSANFGFSYPKGSWMGVMQLDNDEVWNDYVESGKVKGFSIDAFMQLEEVNLKQVDMSETKEGSILELLKELPNKIVLAMTAKNKDTKEELKNVELSLSENGFNAFLKELEESFKEFETNLSKKDIEVKFSEEQKLKFKELEDLVNPLKEENVALKEQLKEIETKLTKQGEDLIELSKAPATETVGNKPRQVDLSKDYKAMTKYEQYLYNKENK